MEQWLRTGLVITLVAIILVTLPSASKVLRQPEPELIGTGSSKPATPPGKENKTFSISGVTEGLFPGGRKPLVLTVQNPQAFAIKIVELRVGVGDVSRGGDATCSGQFLAVSDLAGPVVVAKGGSATVSLEATLAGSAPDSCKDVSFPLTYSGRAEKA